LSKYKEVFLRLQCLFYFTGDFWEGITGIQNNFVCGKKLETIVFSVLILFA